MSAIQQAYDYFVSRGWSKEQSAGIVGNLQAESQLNPVASGDSGLAAGIAQWHPDRQANFLLVTGKTVQAATLEEQLGFVNYELTQGTHKNAGDKLKQATTVDAAASIVGQYYEAPKSTDYSARIANAKNILSGVGVSVSSGITGLFAAIKAGRMPSAQEWAAVASSPGTVAGNVLSGAVDYTTKPIVDGVKGIANFDIGEWISNQLTPAIWDNVKDKLIPIGVGIIAALLVALSVWGMVKDTPVGGAVKTATKVAAFA